MHSGLPATCGMISSHEMHDTDKIPPPDDTENMPEERIDSVTIVGARPMKDIGVQKTVIDGSVLSEDVTLSLGDMLAHATPAFVRSSGRGSMSSLSVRGTGSSHTRVVWNGMSMNSPLFGMMDLSYIPSYFIDGAALYYGASSVAAAGGGLGGALVLDTRPEDIRGFGMRYIQGIASFRTFDEYLKLSYGNDRVRSETSLLVTTSRNDFPYRNYAKKDFVTDDYGNIVGWSYPVERNRNCDYRDIHLLQELYYDAGDAGRFDLSAWYMDSSRNLPLLSTDYSESNSSLSSQKEKTFRSVVRWEKYAGKNKLSAKAGYHYSDIRYTERTERAYGEEGHEVQIRSAWRNYITTLFGNAAWERGLGRKLYLAADISVLQHFVYTINDKPVRPVAQPVVFDDARTELSALVSARYRPVESVGIALNLRQEVIGTEGAPFIPSLQAEWTPGRGNITFKASAARNYRFPTLNDKHFAVEPIMPEVGFTYDVGIVLRNIRRARLAYDISLTAYDSRIRNWILWYPDKGGTQWLPTNIRLVRSFGAEAALNIEWRMGGDWRIALDGVFAWTRSLNMRKPINDNDNAVGKQLPYVPVWSGAVTGRLSWRQWRLVYKWDYYSERFTSTDNSATISGRILPYFMNCISVGYTLGTRFADFSFNFKVNNLFDEEYETEMSRPMPGRNYGLSIEITPRFASRR